MTKPPDLPPELTRFAGELPFALDPFQVRACTALEAGHGVLVCAPTGAGKTVVGEFAVHLALAAGRKCFYTTPIKALSNQKHTDLVRRYGPERIGLLTGDQSINGDAPVVVMTTEVLRNMLYANSAALHGLSHVVMDEVHFLADRMRGAVWEEVILHLSEDVRLVSLSATVSNAEEFGGWIQTVRGDTTVVVDEHRPVPLWQHMMVGKRLFDLFEGDQLAGSSALVDSELLRHISLRREADRLADWQPRGRGGPGRRDHGGRPTIYRPPPRPDVIGVLDHEGLLPAITFVFSRAGCDAAVKQCLRSSLRLTDNAERARIAEVIDRRCAELRRDRPGRARLPRMARRPAAWAGRPPRRSAAGVPSHRRGALHRGPGEGRIRHRDTGSGNQHARPHRRAGTAGEVQRRTARPVDAGGVHPVDRPCGQAGHRRRGARRRAVAAERRSVDPADVAGLASTRTFPLRSSFAPSYNMTINLVQHMGPEQAHQLLERSFAQYQADRSVVGLVKGVARGEKMLGEIAAELGGRDAPILEYARLRAAISGRERSQARASRLQRRRATNDALTALRRGDIINIGQGRRGGLAVVLEPAADGDEPRPLVLTEHRWAGRISSADYTGASAKLGTMTLPKRVEHRQPRVRRDLASALRSAAAGLDVPSRKRSGGGRGSRHRSRTGRAAREDAKSSRPSRFRPGRAGADRRAVPADRTGQRRDSEEGRVGDQLTGPDLRSNRAAAHRTWLHRGTRR